ncbi:MAG: GTPase ObgE [Thermoleophilia bacterium]|nr:GTPase ObgE [Thermoleophilia bacterium]
MFFDHAKIHVAAGNGGNGCVSFRREKHVPRGGPDGGDGGRGGDVIFVADAQLRDLQLFNHKIHFKAGAGEPGHGARKHGANGETVIIAVPLGTQVRVEPITGAEDGSVEGDDGAVDGISLQGGEPEGGVLLADLVHPGEQVTVAQGGLGGHGNARFVNSVRQAPKFAELGEEGESMWLRLSLKLIADAGLAGLPNAGKSSLLRRLSNAKPKVADYPFTTVEPMLGVVDWSGDGDVFTLADVPGLLEGASEGVGLGHEFLAHLERCRLLLHVVDATGYYDTEPLAGFRTILTELDAHAAILAGKPQVVVLNKIDAVPAAVVQELREVFIAEVEQLRQSGHPAFTYVVGEDAPLAGQLVWPVSAATGAGLGALLHWVGPLLRELRATEDASAEVGEGVWASSALVPQTEEGGHGHVVYRPSGLNESGFLVRREKNGFVVRGDAVRRLVRRFDLTDDEASRYVGERLDRLGVYAALRARGAQPGDDVDIEGYAFEFE